MLHDPPAIQPDILYAVGPFCGELLCPRPAPENQKHPQNQRMILPQQNQQTMVFIKKPKIRVNSCDS
jgi:hypothetical protein